MDAPRRHGHGYLLRRSWPADADAPGTRRSRQAASYEAFVPDRLAGADLPLVASTAATAAAAEQSCRDLGAADLELPGFEALARQLLRAESVASSRIEHLVLSHRRLAHAAYADADRDLTARYVLANIRAMEHAVSHAAGAKAITTRLLRDVHRILFEATTDARIAGALRREQNWIGGGSASPIGAEFVPPPASQVEDLLDDLCAFCNRRDVPAVVQAAAAHAQFETIHPFADGNGRVGRALIHVLLVRSGAAATRIPPVSLALAGRGDAYVRGLGDFRFGDRDAWYVTFAQALEASCREGVRFGQNVRGLQEKWAEQAGSPRRDSATSRLIARLPESPVIDLAGARELTGASPEAARLALNALAAAGVLRQVNVGRRNRAWECVGLFDLLDRFERSLGDPSRAPRGTRRTPKR